MKLNLFKTICLLSVFVFAKQTSAQVSPINFEAAGNGASWTWTTFENVANAPVQIIANPSATGLNTSTTVLKMTTLTAGQPYAGFESSHGSGIGTFTLNANNAVVKLMVYKSVISDVGVKFATASGASTGEIKVSNTLINQWEELTFNFTSQIGNPTNTNIDQIIIFPDFKARTSNNDCYIDNITLGTAVVVPKINVKFATQNTDSTPVYVFGNWNNWNNFPGTPMSLNSTTGLYEATLPFDANTTIEYLFVNGIGTKEVLSPSMSCTNGNATYTNRLKVLGSSDVTLCNVFKTCNTCIPTSVKEINKQMISISADANGVIIFDDSKMPISGIKIFNLNGQLVFKSEQKIPTNQKLNINLLSNQMYFVQLQKGTEWITIKTITNN